MPAYYVVNMYRCQNLSRCRATKRYGALHVSRARPRILSTAYRKPETLARCCPFESVTIERGFLPSTDPSVRLELSQRNAAAAEWEAAAGDLPRLAVAAQVAGGGGSGGGRHLLRRALLDLPPFPLEELIQVGSHELFASGRQGNSPASGGAGAPDCAQEPSADVPWPGGPSEGQAAAAGGGSAQLWRTYVVLSFLSNAYVWCEPGDPASVLPARLAVPWVAVAHHLGMPPAMTYASYALYDWRRLDPEGPVALGNLVSLQSFLLCPDEEWFRLLHVEVEAQAAGAVGRLQGMQAAAAQEDVPRLLAALAAVSESLRAMQQTVGRMGEHCDPYVYYHRLRRPMMGWRNNPLLPQGLVYEGVYDKPVQLYGPTGAQSSVVPALDRALDIRHKEGPLREYLQAMVPHMPPAHRAFLDRLSANNSNTSSSSDKTVHNSSGSSSSAGSSNSSNGVCCNGGGPVGANVRDFVMSYGSYRTGELRDAYDEAVGELERFRTAHRAMAASYIMQQHAAGGGGGGRQHHHQHHQQQDHPAADGGTAGSGVAGDPALRGETTAAAAAAVTASPAADTCTAPSCSSRNGSTASSSTTTTGSRARPGTDGQAVVQSQQAQGGGDDAGAQAQLLSGAVNARVPASHEAAAAAVASAAGRDATFIAAAFRTAINAVRALNKQHERESSASAAAFTSTSTPNPMSSTSRGSSNNIVALRAEAGKGQAQGQGEEGVLVGAEATAAVRGSAVEGLLLLTEEEEAGPVGTGGSNVLPALTTFRDTTARHRLREGLQEGLRL